MSRLSSNWLASYCQFADFTEAPAKFHFWTGVSVIAGALRRRVWVDMKNFQWTPNFYIVFVAPPGVVQKSTTSNLGMSLLREIPEIRFGPDAVTWQSLVESLSEAAEEAEIGGEFYTMSPVTICSSEFGTFLDPNNREMVDVLVSLWDGQISTFEKKTKTSGNDMIVNPWINIIACTTPSWIAENFPEYMIGGGFTSRTLFVYAEKKEKLVAYPDEVAPKNFEKVRRDLVADLEDMIANCKGPMVIDKGGREWGHAWYEKLHKGLANKLADRFDGYMARKQTHLHKLAMVISVAKSNSRIITAEDLMQAEAILNANEIDMPRVFAKIGSEHSQHARAIKDMVESQGRLSYRQCFRNMFHQLSYDDFVSAVGSAIQAGFVYQKNVGGTLFLYAVKQDTSGVPNEHASES